MKLVSSGEFLNVVVSSIRGRAVIFYC
jgi:hypothetical protein